VKKTEKVIGNSHYNGRSKDAEIPATIKCRLYSCAEFDNEAYNKKRTRVRGSSNDMRSFKVYAAIQKS